jgi:curved DNA-binding protein CbpA
MKVYNVDFYSLLGLPRSASDKDINTNYKKLSKAIHPDKNSQDIFYTAHCQLLNEAKDVLGNPLKRKEYDSIFFGNRYNTSSHNILYEENEELKEKLSECSLREEKLKTRLHFYLVENDELKKQIEENKTYKNSNRQKKYTIAYALLLVIVAGLVYFLSTNFSERKASIPFLVKSIDFANSSDTTKYDHSFKKKRARYINPRLYVNPLSNVESDVQLTVKFVKPDGEINTYPKDSKVGYTYQYVVKYSPKKALLTLPGWGNKTNAFFDSGVHHVEIWLDEYIIGKGSFTIID